VFDLSPVDPTKTTVLVRPDLQMPEVCCDCGMNTPRKVKVQTQHTRKAPPVEPDDDGGCMMGCLASLLIPAPILLLLQLGKSRRKKHRVLKLVVRVPQCGICAGNKIRPLQASYQRGTMKLLVDKRFAESLREANADGWTEPPYPQPQ